MSTKSERWDYLNRLGEEYYGLVQQGYGATLENRCQRQIDIASKLVASVVPFLNKIAGELVEKGKKINTVHGLKYFSLRGTRTTVEDLVQEGALGLIKEMGKYNPQRCRIST